MSLSLVVALFCFNNSRDFPDTMYGLKPIIQSKTGSHKNVSLVQKGEQSTKCSLLSSGISLFCFNIFREFLDSMSGHALMIPSKQEITKVIFQKRIGVQESNQRITNIVSLVQNDRKFMKCISHPRVESHIRTTLALYTDTRYNDKIRYSFDFTKPSLRSTK